MFFYREGDACGQFALVGTGSIRVFKVGETGREITLYHVRDGEACLINMLCVLLGRPAMACAVTEKQVDAVIVPGGAAREWVDTDSTIRSFVLEAMGQRLVDVMTLVEEVAFRRMDDRLARLLLQRFVRFRVIPATHEDIAAELGTAREVISRLLKEFARQGAIGIARGQIELRDEQVLHDLANDARKMRVV